MTSSNPSSWEPYVLLKHLGTGGLGETIIAGAAWGGSAPKARL